MVITAAVIMTSMPTIHSNLGHCFDATRAPSKVAIIDTANWEHPREWTYAQLDAECDAVARGLLAKGLQRGDRVGILSLNRFELLAAYFGTMRAGLVSVPISFKLPRETIDHMPTCAPFSVTVSAPACARPGCSRSTSTTPPVTRRCAIRAGSKPWSRSTANWR